jgi:ornithine cyclodeaminase
MTLLITPQHVQSMIQHQGLSGALNRIKRYIEVDYLRWSEFDKSARIAHHSTDGVIELMPISDGKLYSFKYVNGHPYNHRLGLPTVMAFGVLAQVETGQPEVISELTLTTALRTAATSVLAAQSLARPNSRSMALIGNGAQSEFQALAFHYLMGINEIRLFDIDPAATRKLLSNLGHLPSLRWVVCSSTAEAVKGVDIITTVTADKTQATIITPNMVEPGMFINGVGGDCPGKTEIHPDVLRRSKVVVEFEPQSRIEGDVQQMPADFAVTELWQILKGQASGREDPAQITFFDSVGFALEDFSALRWVRDSALELELGQSVPLIPNLPDPKNLYSLLQMHKEDGQVIHLNTKMKIG